MELVTGGAGFIGSHLVDRLLAGGHEVVVLDDFSTGSPDNLRHHPDLRIVRGSLLEPADIAGALGGITRVWHLAANPDVRTGAANPRSHWEQNAVATFNLLEAMRRGGVRDIVFTSSSVVYGEPSVLPTPEYHGPLLPISVYGGAKLAAEGLICAWAHTFGMRAVIFRFANVVGPRAGHGVIPDFIRKLRADPSRLDILGDGTQSKSYLHVSDCIDGMLFGVRHAAAPVDIFNLSTPQRTMVREVADAVVAALGLRDVRYTFTSGMDDGRGWPGDVKTMQLDITKLVSLGWSPRLASGEAVRRAAVELVRPA